MSHKHLQPCRECGRHVRASESACPFCGASVSAAPAPALPQARLTRAALVAFGLAVTATACGGGSNSSAGGTVTQGGSSSSGGEGPSTGGGVDSDAGSPVSTDDGGSATPDASPVTPDDAGVVALYGAAAPRYGAPPLNEFV
jgi:hypothetical protein